MSRSSVTRRAAASGRSKAATSPNSSPTPSGRISSSCRLSSARMRSMTAPARWSSSRMSSRMARISSRSGGCLLQEQRRRLGVAQDGAERLVDLVRQRGGQLPHHRNAAHMGDLLAQAQQSPARPACARVMSHAGAPRADRPALRVEFDPALGGDPADVAVRQQQRNSVWYSPGAGRGFSRAAARPVAIVGMHLLIAAPVASGSVGVKPSSSRLLAVRPGLVALEVAAPRCPGSPRRRPGPCAARFHAAARPTAPRAGGRGSARIAIAATMPRKNRLA